MDFRRGLLFNLPMIKRQYSADFENLDAMRELVAEAARKWGFAEQDVYNLQLVVDEAATNIIEHTYENQTGQNIELLLEKQGRSLVLTLIDQGDKFVPQSIPIPSNSPNLDTMNVGGLGLYFIHKLMDEVSYHYEAGRGNVLRMVKFLPAKHKPASAPAQGIAEVFELGRKLLDAATLEARKELILQATARLVAGECAVWLDESGTRLPDQAEDVFEARPPSRAMDRAVRDLRVVRNQSAERATVALPIENDGVALGALEVSRPIGERFNSREINILTGICQTISIAYVAWNQLEIERFRQRQLNLVRNVTNQITNETDLPTLARKVTRLIHSTFKYYYVGIYTLEAGNQVVFMAGMGGSTRERGFVHEIPIAVTYGAGMVGSAAAEGNAKYAANVATDELYIPLEILPDTRSELALPLRLDDKVLGVLDLQSEKVDGFHPNDILVLQTLADGIAKAIEGSVLFGELREQARRMQLIGEVARQINTILDLGELMRRVAELLTSSLGYPFVHLFTVHPNRRKIVYESGSGPRAAAMEGYVIDLDDSEGVIPWVAREGKTALLNDARKDRRYVDSPLAPFETRSELCVPLVYNNQTNGLIDIQSGELGAFTEVDQALLETLAGTIAAAIRNADLYQSEQWRRQTGDSLREVAGLLSANASLEQVLDAILTELERNLPSDISAIWLGDEQNLHCAAAHNVDPAALEAIRDREPQCFGVVQAAMHSAVPYIRRATDPIGPSAMYGGYNPNHSAIFVPLRIGEQAVGVLTMVHHSPGRYGHEASAMTTTFGSYASVAIENTRLYDAAQEQAYASAALLQVAQAVVSLTNLEDILTTITRVLPILVGVQRVIIFTRDDAGNLSPAEEYGIPDGLRAGFWKPYPAGSFPLLDVAVAEEAYALSAEASRGFAAWQEARVCPQDEMEQAMNSEERLLVAIPLMIKGESYGVMLVEEADGGRRFRSRRFEILTGVAQQITLALQNENYQREKLARERLDVEVRVARQIQETFIPRAVEMPAGWQFAGTWITATQMGGDLYDLLPLENGTLGIFIADVADKGIPAALFMALTRSLLHAAVQLYPSPAEAMEWVNSKLYPDCEQGMFVTAFFGILDPATGRLRYCNAGHNPPLVLAGGQFARLTRTGIALGVLDQPGYHQAEVTVDPAGYLCLYTDGVTESFRDGVIAYGEEGLTALLRRTEGNSCQEMLELLLEDLNNFTGGIPLRDDISVVLLRREPEGDTTAG